MEGSSILTKEGYKRLSEELVRLKEDKRPKAVSRLKKAREMGDLSENSEYAAAKEDLRFVDRRIAEIEQILSVAKVIKKDPKSSKVNIGDTVEVSVNGEREVFSIVGEAEADMAEKRLSHTSPIGEALLGRKTGDTVEIETPGGKTTYKIINKK